MKCRAESCLPHRDFILYICLDLENIARECFELLRKNLRGGGWVYSKTNNNRMVLGEVYTSWFGIKNICNQLFFLNSTGTLWEKIYRFEKQISWTVSS